MSKFQKDFREVGKPAEDEWNEILKLNTGSKGTICCTSDYDILHNGIKYEIKDQSRKSEQTGNLFIETHSWHRQTGIEITDADYWCQKVYYEDGPFWTIIPTSKIREFINDKRYLKWVSGGGDTSSNSCGYLFRVNFWVSNSMTVSDFFQSLKE